MESKQQRTLTASGAPADGTSALPERYRDCGRIARGGWGEVRRVHDLVMDREVAMKILAWEHLESADVRARFLNEARVTASLAHPGVVPVHDQGVLADGRPWFTMKIVDGPTLDVARETVGSVTRLLGAMLRVSETVGFAHDRGLVHRDLKPRNLMLGAFGEVLVLDWGIACRAAGAGDGASCAGLEAREIAGTVAYMSPEQAEGGPVDPESDVFSLGLVLYYVLTGREARAGAEQDVWAMALRGITPELDASTPDELAAIYARAVRPRRDDRFQDAGALGAALRGYLDGEARRGKADAWVARAEALACESADLRRASEEVRARARAIRSSLDEHAPVEDKRPLWTLEDEAAALDRRIALLDAEHLDALRLALEEHPPHELAHRALAAAYRARLETAEAAHQHADASAFELLLRRHDRGEHRAFLQGRGRLTLVTEPSGARVDARRYEMVDRRLVLGPAWELGRTPLRDAELPRGSYVLEIARAGCATVRYPVRIERDRGWDSTRPGEDGPTPVVLPPGAALGTDEIYVPAGWAPLGGDALATEPVPGGRRWIEGFVIRRFPVTLGEYLCFLDDLVRDGREDEAHRAAPRLMRGTGDESADPRAVVLEQGRFRPTPDEWGREPDLRRPIACVSWFAACRYARWLAARTGQPWRLPSELEWEKAARGVDERVYPWGAQPETTWACILGSSADTPARVPVDGFPEDESPYGVRGLAGNVRDWCLEPWTADGPAAPDSTLRLGREDEGDALRAIRGGAWNTVPAFARLAGRFAAAPDQWFGVVGFRVARSFP